jgi:hypothetical protein
LYVRDDIEERLWPEAVHMLQVWREDRGARRAPARTRLTPAKIAEEMPYMSIFDIRQEPFQMTCRLMGSKFVNAIGVDYTGKTTDDVDRTDLIVRRAKWIIQHIEPMLLIGLPLIWSPRKRHKSYDTLCLPFVDQEEQVDTILYLNIFHAA